MNRIAVITRLFYPSNTRKGREAFERRYALWDLLIRPRVQRQQSPFDYWVLCNAHDSCLFRAAGIQTWIPDELELTSQRKPFDFIPYRAVEGMPKYEYQVAMDSDDFPLQDGFVARAVWELQKLGNYTGHVSFQWKYFDMNTLKFYESKYKYSIDKGSAVFAMRHPEPEKKYRFIYEESHLTTGKKMERQAFVADDNWCAVTTHDHNDSTVLRPA